MGKFTRFEDIAAWQQARSLVREIYRVSNEGYFKKDFALRDQIRRSSLSIGSNIAEGFARRTNREFAYFLYVSHGSLAEVQTQLYVALDIEYIDRKKFLTLYDHCDRISRMVMALIKYLSSSPRYAPLPDSPKPFNSGDL